MTQSSEQQPNLWPALEARVRDAVHDKLKGSRHGIAVVSIHMLADSRGDPIFYLEPSVNRVEPASNAMQTVLKLISDRLGLGS